MKRSPARSAVSAPSRSRPPSDREHRDRRWRTSDGELDLNEGDVVAFPRADDGLHQVRNHTDAPVRVLMLSTLVAPDLVRYPDSGTFAARDVKGERLLLIRPGPMLDYWDGEARSC